MPFEAEIRVSPRSRRLSIRVQPGGKTVVVVPKGISRERILDFMRGHKVWTERATQVMERFNPRPSKQEARQSYLRHKSAARRFAYAAIAKYAPQYGVEVKAVSIRDQSTRWGSCSRDGKISFNYRLALLPTQLSEYVVVHELCHILEFNHSSRFWDLVSRTTPNHRALRKLLKTQHSLAAVKL